ncbi:MAG TPA: hypothetical protein VMG33_06450 [Steroidobacteraceae bacterium]|nr:hypothetical protein [Steroidobacteraceae bacterium]
MLKVLLVSVATFAASFGVTAMLLVLRERYMPVGRAQWHAENDLLRW